MRIAHAIFTSVQGCALSGYQLAARCDEISSAVAQELSKWGPAHDSLLNSGAGAMSINFHPLSSGEYCLSQTVRAGEEYSGRGGGRIWTHMFVLPPELLGRFDNHVLKVLQALQAAGRVATGGEVPQQLYAFPLSGGSQCDQLDASQVAEWTPAAARALVAGQHVAVRAAAQARQWLFPLISAVPHSHRLRVSFTTGLRQCATRPFQLFALPSDENAARQVVRQTSALVIDPGCLALS